MMSPPPVESFVPVYPVAKHTLNDGQAMPENPTVAVGLPGVVSWVHVEPASVVARMPDSPTVIHAVVVGQETPRPKPPWGGGGALHVWPESVVDRKSDWSFWAKQVATDGQEMPVNSEVPTPPSSGGNDGAVHVMPESLVTRT
jgi:hypothetical protein